jgi:hypothetical protein
LLKVTAALAKCVQRQKVELHRVTQKDRENQRLKLELNVSKLAEKQLACENQQLREQVQKVKAAAVSWQEAIQKELDEAEGLIAELVSENTSLRQALTEEPHLSLRSSSEEDFAQGLTQRKEALLKLNQERRETRLAQEEAKE